MAGKRLGSIFVELGLDSTEFTKGEARILQSAQTTSLSVEKNWRALGGHSDRIFNAMRDNVINAQNAIVNNEKVSASERIRAQEAAATKIKYINERQYGHHTSMIDKLKANWIAAAAAIGVAIGVMYKAWRFAEVAANFEEMERGLQGLSARYNMTADSAIQMAKSAVNGQLSMMEAGKLAARAFALGFNPQQVKEFLIVSEKLTDVMGGTIPEAFEAMERAAATGRKGALVSIGINVDLKKAIADYADKLGIAKESISSHLAEQIRANVIMEEAKKITDRLGVSTETTADKMNRMKAILDDAQLFMGQITIRIAALTIGITDWGVTLASMIPLIFTKVSEGFYWLLSKIPLIGRAYKAIYGEAKKNADANLAILKGSASMGLDAIMAAFSARQTISAKMNKLVTDEAEHFKAAKGVEAQILKALLDQYKKTYEMAAEAADHSVKMQVLSGQNELNFALGAIDAKEIALNTEYEMAAAAIKKHVSNNAVATAKLQELWSSYSKDWQKLEDQKMEKSAQVIEFQKKAYSSYVIWEQQQRTKEIESERSLGGERVKVNEQTWDAMYQYQQMTGQKMTKDQMANAELTLSEYKDTFAGGVRTALYELQHNEETWGKASYDIVKEFASDSNKAMSDILFDGIKGNLKSLGDYFSSFFNSLLRTFTDILAKMFTQWLLFSNKTGAVSVAGAATTSMASAATLGSMGISPTSSVASGASASSGYLTSLGNLLPSAQQSVASLAANTTAYGFGVEAGAKVGNSILGLSTSAFSGWAAGIATFIADMVSGKSFQDSIVHATATGLGTYGGAAIGTYFLPGIGTTIGALIGGLLGSYAGNWLNTLIHGHNQTLTLGYLTQYKEIFDKTFDKTKGFEPPEWTMPRTSETAVNLGPAADAYQKAISLIQLSFNDMVFDFVEKLPADMNKQIIDELAATNWESILYGVSKGRWDFSQTQAVLTTIAKNYADALAKTLGNAYANALSNYIATEGAAGLIGDTSVWEVLTDRVQANINTMYQNIAATIKGGDMEGGLKSIEEVNKVISNIAQAMAPISEIIATKDMSDYELSLYNINKQFDAYAEQLKAAGVDLAKYTDLETARGIALSKVAREQSVVSAELQGYVDKLKSAKESMRMEGFIYDQMRVATAGIAFNAVLAQARLGDFSGLKNIDSTLATLTANANSTNAFATRQEYEANFYKTYNSISELQSLTESQISIEQQTLNVLYNIDANIAKSTGGKVVSAASGLDYVPRDNFLINAHQGEAVLNRQSAAAWRGGADSAELVSEIRMLRDEIQTGNFAIARNTLKSAKIAERWDADGLPPERT